MRTSYRSIDASPSVAGQRPNDDGQPQQNEQAAPKSDQRGQCDDDPQHYSRSDSSSSRSMAGLLSKVQSLSRPLILMAVTDLPWRRPKILVSRLAAGAFLAWNSTLPVSSPGMR